MSTYFDEASDGEDGAPAASVSSATEPETITDPEAVLAKSAEFKAQGNAYFSAGEFEQSVEQYSSAISTLKKAGLPPDCIIHLNRSAAYLSLKNYVKAMHDANVAAELDPSQWKAHWRKGVGMLIVYCTCILHIVILLV